MKNHVLIVCLALIYPQTSLAEESEFDAIVNIEMLTDYLGEPSSLTVFDDQGMAFTHYYYQELNHSFLINNELWEVCHHYHGDAVLSCFVCKENEALAECRDKLSQTPDSD